MRRWVLIVIGVLLTGAGIVWALQGLGYLAGSMMTGATVWAVVGPVVAVVGLVMIAVGVRRRRPPHSTR